MPPKPASKRKAPDDPPSTSKRVRKDPPATASKRKVPNGEVVASGLVIIREPSSRTSSQQSVRPPDASSSMSRSPPPPTKKFKASSSDPPARVSSTKGKEKAALMPVPEEQDVEEDVRAMETEANDIRLRSKRSSTNHTTPVGHTDTIIPLEPRETPRIEANRAMRAEGAGSSGPSTPRQTHGRRSSFSSRGKRTSMGSDPSIITTPHRSVEDKHFYRYLDYESPDAARMSELLVWCIKRSLSLSPQGSSAKMSGKDPPALAPEQDQILRDVIDDTIKMLRAKKIDTRVNGSERPDPRTQVKGNEQNEKNRARHIQFTAEIDRIKAEMEEWSRVDKYYEKLQVSFQAEQRQRKAEDAKTKGKRRAAPELWLDEDSPRFNELPSAMRNAAEDMLRIVATPLTPPAPDPRLAEQLNKADRLRSNINAGLQTVKAIEMDLDRRFVLMNLEMQRRDQPPVVMPLPIGPSHAIPAQDPQELVRALAHVDMTKPPAQVSDAARRAARDVKRAQEDGTGVGERRLTGVPPPTPRKAPPGTPRRIGTPGAKR
ncbi:Mis12-Mtw1 protein family-domain-containing protein [Vararia minispora EC-137]|uniref:Mis12-Mtw1 protein family-domain-containing protein n=1 Tax=Vararia minispora EC-137 TaxID=1314806 RepID=A0ACB8QUP0_9AGAM|nr:Mis12-Mtw1 protein family-domain-containing protein [Vararia minispora EC-137]